MNKVFDEIISEFRQFPQISAIAVGGSQMADTADDKSDIDVYIFVNTAVPLDKRLEIIKKYSSNYEAGGEYFGSGDELWVDDMNRQLDVMYFDKNWMESVVHNVWEKHFPSNGYTTCFLFTIKNCEPLYDKDGWLQGLKNKLNSPYPQELKQNIIKRNMMLMKDKPFASYYEQIEKALSRGDLNSVNHRIAAFMASYFDVTFAVNELLHPGEKKLVDYALKHCSILPDNFKENIDRLFTAYNAGILKVLDDMIISLKDCI